MPDDWKWMSKPPQKSFLRHAKLISLLTLVSRILGMLRESLAAKYFGAGLVSSAFTVAFTVPNLFRKLFGEGALSAAFIPLYAQALRNEDLPRANRFAAASVNLLVLILIALTIVGEFVLMEIFLFWPGLRPDRVLALKLTAIMLPYVLLVCGTAFLGAILQVHRRFGMTAAAPIVLNVALVLGTLAGARLFDMKTIEGQTRAVVVLSVVVLVAGVAQVLMLLPSLRAVGFQFRPLENFRTPQISRMLRLSAPVAIGAGVLQLSVMLDKGISFLLARSYDENGRLIEVFRIFGRTIAYPMHEGAAARLNWAQYLYQFPLGVFAIALATAIFPALSADALDKDRASFKAGLRRGIEATLWEGIPAAVGLVLIRVQAIRVLFEHGRFTPDDTRLVAQSVLFYGSAIWAFSLQQILNRAYYALHDTKTPLVMSVVTLGVNLAVEIPLLWLRLPNGQRLGEAGMAAGTCASFALQAIVMLFMIRKRLGGLDLHTLVPFVAKVLLSTGVMAIALLACKQLPFYPPDHVRHAPLIQLVILLIVGAGTYLAACAALGIHILGDLIPSRMRRSPASGR